MPVLPLTICHNIVTSNGFIQLTDNYLDLTRDNTYQTPTNPTTIIVPAPKPGSFPVHELGSINSPFPFVETYHTKYAENDDIRIMKEAMKIFT